MTDWEASADLASGAVEGSPQTQGLVRTSSPPSLHQASLWRIFSGRRVDGLEQRLSQQDSANRGILEQLMKIQQDFKVGLGSWFSNRTRTWFQIYSYELWATHYYIIHVKCNNNVMHVKVNMNEMRFVFLIWLLYLDGDEKTRTSHFRGQKSETETGVCCQWYNIK